MIKFLTNIFKAKIEQLKTKVAQLEAQNRTIRESTVRMQAKVEQEEEYISNMLLKRIQKLKNDKESLALKYEQEEEFLTNDLTRKLTQLEGERDELATRLSQEQNWVVNNLLAKIRKLEAEIQNNHKVGVV
jgi:coiled-coil domain-containing protein 6